MRLTPSLAAPPRNFCATLTTPDSTTSQTAQLPTATALALAHAAISALIYRFGGDPKEKERAEQLADETVELYKTAANFIYEKIDNKSGNMKGGWWDEQKDLPGLIELEKKDRAELARLFEWDTVAGDKKDGAGDSAKLGTTLSAEE